LVWCKCSKHFLAHHADGCVHISLSSISTYEMFNTSMINFMCLAQQ
jgi:hypothetical protein